MSEQQKVAALLTQYEFAEQWLEHTQSGTCEERMAMAASNKAYIKLTCMGVQLYDPATYSYVGRQSLEQFSR